MWPRVLAVAEVLRAALLVRPVASSVARPEGLDVVGSGGLVRAWVAAVSSWRPVVNERSSCPVPRIHRLRLPLRSSWLQTTVAASGCIMLDVRARILADLVWLHLRH